MHERVKQAILMSIPCIINGNNLAQHHIDTVATRGSIPPYYIQYQINYYYYNAHQDDILRDTDVSVDPQVTEGMALYS